MARDMIGKVALCQHGIAGIITEQRSIMYYGKTLGGKDWQSKNPTIIADSIDEFILNNIETYINKLEYFPIHS